MLGGLVAADRPGLRTGLRQTTLPLPAGSVVCLYTDGLAEARTEKSILGRPRLGDIVGELGRDATAPALLDRVSPEARLVTDDMATVVFTPTAGVTAGRLPLGADRDRRRGGRGRHRSSGSSRRAASTPSRCSEAPPRSRAACRAHGGAVIHVRFGMRGPQVEVLPRNVESSSSPQRRAATA